MKITRRQIRKLIRESYMKERYAEIESAILPVLWDNPGIAGLELVQKVQAYGWGRPDKDGAPPEANEIFSILDNLLEEDEVVFNVEEDQWSLSDMGNYYGYERGFKS